jgi:hypothetical protein
MAAAPPGHLGTGILATEPKRCEAVRVVPITIAALLRGVRTSKRHG